MAAMLWFRKLAVVILCVVRGFRVFSLYLKLEFLANMCFSVLCFWFCCFLVSGVFGFLVLFLLDGFGRLPMMGDLYDGRGSQDLPRHG